MRLSVFSHTALSVPWHLGHLTSQALVAAYFSTYITANMSALTIMFMSMRGKEVIMFGLGDNVRATYKLTRCYFWFILLCSFYRIESFVGVLTVLVMLSFFSIPIAYKKNQVCVGAISFGSKFHKVNLLRTAPPPLSLQDQVDEQMAKAYDMAEEYFKMALGGRGALLFYTSWVWLEFFVLSSYWSRQAPQGQERLVLLFSRAFLYSNKVFFSRMEGRDGGIMSKHMQPFEPDQPHLSYLY